MYANENKQYWENCNYTYSKVWEPLGRQEMSRRELVFISAYLSKYKPHRILDIGVGNGRILNTIIQKAPVDAEIFGLDVSEKMAKICREKFKNELRVKQVLVCDLSQENINFDKSLDFVTMIRVLKYNKNWPEIIKKVHNNLKRGGVYIFTMPNKISLSVFSGDTFSDQNIPILYSSQAELKKILRDAGFKLVEFRAFSKMPNFLYHKWENRFYVRCLIFLEKSLELLFGKSFLGRELFIVCIA